MIKKLMKTCFLVSIILSVNSVLHATNFTNSSTAALNNLGINTDGTTVPGLFSTETGLGYSVNIALAASSLLLTNSYWLTGSSLAISATAPYITPVVKNYLRIAQANTTPRSRWERMAYYLEGFVPYFSSTSFIGSWLKKGKNKLGVGFAAASLAPHVLEYIYQTSGVGFDLLPHQLIRFANNHFNETVQAMQSDNFEEISTQINNVLTNNMIVIALIHKDFLTWEYVTITSLDNEIYTYKDKKGQLSYIAAAQFQQLMDFNQGKITSKLKKIARTFRQPLGRFNIIYK